MSYMAEANAIAAQLRGRAKPPGKKARKLIEFCATKGLHITFDHVYGDAALGACKAAHSEAKEAAHG